MTHNTEFARWANKVRNYGSGLGAEASLKGLILEMYNEAGHVCSFPIRVRLELYVRILSKLATTHLFWSYCEARWRSSTIESVRETKAPG